MAREKAKKITTITEPKQTNVNNSDDKPFNLYAEEVNDIKLVTDNHAAMVDAFGEEIDNLIKRIEEIPIDGTPLTTDQISAIATLKSQLDSGKVFSDFNYTMQDRNKVNSFVPVNTDDFVRKDGNKTLTDLNFTSILKTKLDAVAPNATANSTDAELKKRSNHTGTQSADTIDDGTTNKSFTAVEKIKLANLLGDGSIPIEVELATDLKQGAISVTTGALDVTNTTSKYSGFIPVNSEEYLLVTLKTTDYNTSPPIIGTGLAGYSAANYSSFISTPLNSFPVGDIMSVERYNQAHGTNLSGSIHIKQELVKLPAGVNFVNGSSPNDVVLSIKAIRNSGSWSNVIKQLYQKVNVNGSGGGQIVSESGSGFTEEYKNKIDLLPTSFPEFRDGIFYLPDFGAGEQVKAYIRNKDWVIEALASTFGAFSYPLGYAYDYDKRNNAPYQAIVNKSKIVSAENGTTEGHLRPTETTWNWTEAQAIINYCRANNMKFHWAHLLWPQESPTWLKTKVAANPATAKAILTDYVTVSFTTTLNWIKANAADVVVSINVTNEWFYNGDGPNDSSKGGKFKDGMWNNNFTDEELFEMCFTIANQIAPQFIYYCNDVTQETSNEKQSDTYKRLIDGLKAKNIFVGEKQVQVEGMGFQMHTYVGLDIDVLKRRLKYWVDRNMKVMYTEMDVLALTSSPADYTVVKQQRQADTVISCITAYERVVPLALRGGVIFWTVDDDYYINNQGLNAPDSETNPITEFPAMHDYYGQPKPVWQRLLELPNREELNWDVFQDFIATGVVSPLDGTMSTGKLPLMWQKVGTAANVIAVNASGFGASQSSSNTYNFAVLDYPFANRMVTAKLSALTSATRTFILCVRFQDANNYIGAQATNSIWQLVRRSSSTGSNVDAVLYASSILPKVGDVPKLVANGDQITFYLNGVILITVTETQFKTSTKLAVKVRGFDDKFTRISEIGANKL